MGAKNHPWSNQRHQRRHQSRSKNGPRTPQAPPRATQANCPAIRPPNGAPFRTQNTKIPEKVGLTSAPKLKVSQKVESSRSMRRHGRIACRPPQFVSQIAPFWLPGATFSIIFSVPKKDQTKGTTKVETPPYRPALSPSGTRTRARVSTVETQLSSAQLSSAQLSSAAAASASAADSAADSASGSDF